MKRCEPGVEKVSERPSAEIPNVQLLISNVILEMKNLIAKCKSNERGNILSEWNKQLALSYIRDGNRPLFRPARFSPACKVTHLESYQRSMNRKA